MFWFALRAGRGEPGGSSLFFASPKKSNPKKGDPTVCVPSLRCGQPAVLGPAGVPLELASLRQSRALIRLALRSSAHTEGTFAVGFRLGFGFGVTDSGSESPRSRSRSRKSRSGWACEWGKKRDQGCALFERSEFAQTPAFAPIRRLPEGPQTAGRLSFAYFSLAKQRKVRRCRALPDNPRKVTSDPQKHPAQTQKP